MKHSIHKNMLIYSSIILLYYLFIISFIITSSPEKIGTLYGKTILFSYFLLNLGGTIFLMIGYVKKGLTLLWLSFSIACLSTFLNGFGIVFNSMSVVDYNASLLFTQILLDAFPPTIGYIIYLYNRKELNLSNIFSLLFYLCLIIFSLFYSQNLIFSRIGATSSSMKG